MTPSLKYVSEKVELSQLCPVQAKLRVDDETHVVSRSFEIDKIWIFTDSGFVNEGDADLKISLWHNWLIFLCTTHLITVSLRLKICLAVMFELAQIKTSCGI